MAAQQQDDEEMISGINVTPLVDITLVLLIIFMVTATYIVKASIDVDLPHAAHGGEDVGEMFTVVLKQADNAPSKRDAPCDQLAVNGSATDVAGLKQALRDAVAKDKDTKVLIAADKLCTHGEFVDVVDMVKDAGITKFAINIEKDASAPVAQP